MAGERGEKGGVVLDSGGAEEGAEPVEGNDAALTPIEEVNEVVAQPSREADLNRGAETPQDGAVDSGEEGAVDESGEGARTENQPQIKEIVDNAIKEAFANIPKPQEPTKQYTEEDWAKMESEWGMPRTAIDRVTRQNVQIVNQIMEHIDSRIAKIEFGNALETFSKQPGFTDATRYRKDIDSFLGNYDPKHWSNPQLLKMAVFYARGVNANGNVQKAMVGAERNRKISGQARPSSPGGGVRRSAMPPLTESQRQAAELMGGESEYRKFQVNGRRKILE